MLPVLPPRHRPKEASFIPFLFPLFPPIFFLRLLSFPFFHVYLLPFYLSVVGMVWCRFFIGESAMHGCSVERWIRSTTGRDRRLGSRAETDYWRPSGTSVPDRYAGTTDGRADAGELRLAVDDVACCRRRWLADRRPIEKLDKPSTTGTGGDDGKVAFGRRRAHHSPCCALACQQLHSTGAN